MNAQVIWQHNMAFDGLLPSGHTIPLDGDYVDTNGISPMQVVLVALCGCTAMNVVSILKKKREPIRGLIVSAIAEEASQPPKVFTIVQLSYRVAGAVSHQAMEHAIHLSETKYCPVAAMVSKTAKIGCVIEYTD